MAEPAALTHARVLRIALPIVLSNVTVPLLGAVDTAVVGQMGQAAPIGAVGMGAVILVTLYWVFGFLRMGTSGLAAQAHGAGDLPERGAILIRALLIAAAAGLVLIAAQAMILRGAFLVAPASAEGNDHLQRLAAEGYPLVLIDRAVPDVGASNFLGLPRGAGPGVPAAARRLLPRRRRMASPSSDTRVSRTCVSSCWQKGHFMAPGLQVLHGD